MKKWILFCLLAVLFVGAQAKIQGDKDVVTTTFAADIKCQACANKILSNVNAFGKGVKDVKVNVDRKWVIVRYDSTQTNVAALRQVLAGLNFKSCPVNGVGASKCGVTGKNCQGCDLKGGCKCTPQQNCAPKGQCGSACGAQSKCGAKAASACKTAKCGEGKCKDACKSKCDKAQKACGAQGKCGEKAAACKTAKCGEGKCKDACKSKCDKTKKACGTQGKCKKQPAKACQCGKCGTPECKTACKGKCGA